MYRDRDPGTGSKAKVGGECVASPRECVGTERLASSFV
jgi:hypothetical protein